MKKTIFKNIALTVLLLAVMFMPSLLGFGVSMAAGVITDSTVSNQIWGEDTDWNQIDWDNSVKEIGKDIFFLTAMTNELNKTRPTDSIITGVGQVGEDIYFDTITLASGIAANTALTNTNLPTTLMPSDLTKYKQFDVIQFVDIHNEKGENIQCTVQPNGSGGLVFKVTNPDGTTASPKITAAIAAGSHTIMRMGKSVNELAGMVEGYNLLPSPFTNYCQKFMETLVVTERSLKQKKNINYEIEDYLRGKIRDYKLKREISKLFGLKAKTTDTNGYELYISGGITNQSTNPELVMTGLTNPDYFSMGETVFSNLKSSTRAMMICGPGAMRKMLNIQGFEKNFTTAETEVVLGAKIKAIDTGFGTIMPKVLPQMLCPSSFYNKALFFDPTKIVTKEFTPFSNKDLENKNNEHIVAKSIWEETCVLLEDPNAATVVNFTGV